jgi:hypothetical protein
MVTTVIMHWIPENPLRVDFKCSQDRSYVCKVMHMLVSSISPSIMHTYFKTLYPINIHNFYLLVKTIPCDCEFLP